MTENAGTPGAANPAAKGIAAITEYLTAHGVAYEVVEHEESMSAAAEARATNRQLKQVAKTVVLRDATADVLAILPASERLDLRKARDVLGATRHLRLATEAEMAADFPMIEVGATPPIGPMTPKVEVVDPRLLEEARVLCPGGDHRHSILLDPREIVRVTSAEVADICEDSPPASTAWFGRP